MINLRNLAGPAALLPMVLLTGCSAGWEAAFDGSTYGALSGVWGSSPDNIFIVGGYFDEAQIVHFDGESWSDMEAPDLPLLAWVYGWGPDQVMSVGVDGAAAWYDGSTWSILETPTEEDLWGVFGFSPDDVWVVGGDATDAGSAPVVLHWDGSEFTEVVIDPEEMPRNPASLFKVWGIDDTLFALGQNGQIVKWDGSAWRNSPGGSGADQDFVSLWGPSSDNIVSVGGRGNGRVGVWDGVEWETLQPSGIGGLNAVSMLDDEVAVIGGINGLVATFQPATGELLVEEYFPGGDIHAIWGDGEGNYYAVGGRFVEPLSGMAYVRTGPLK